MRKLLGYLILLVVLSCTATFISVRRSDNATISTTVDQDSMRIGGGQWDWDDNDSINVTKNKNVNQKDSIK